MLPETRQVDELEVDDFDLQVFCLGEHLLGRGLGLSDLQPGRDGHGEALSSRCVSTPRLRPSRGPATALLVTLLPRHGRCAAAACPAPAIFALTRAAWGRIPC